MLFRQKDMRVREIDELALVFEQASRSGERSLSPVTPHRFEIFEPDFGDPVEGRGRATGSTQALVHDLRQ